MSLIGALRSYDPGAFAVHHQEAEKHPALKSFGPDWIFHVEIFMWSIQLCHWLNFHSFRSLRLAQEFLAEDMEMGLDHFKKTKMGVYERAEDFCAAFNELDGPGYVSSTVVPYAGKTWICQLSFREGPLLCDGNELLLTWWGLYVLPTDVPPDVPTTQ